MVYPVLDVLPDNLSFNSSELFCWQLSTDLPNILRPGMFTLTI